jgi:hypothetical protein
LGQSTPILFTFPRLYLLPKIPSPKSLYFMLHLPSFASAAVTEQMAEGEREHHTKGQHRDSYGRFCWTDPFSTVGKVKLGPAPSSMDSKVKLAPPPSSMTSKVKLSPTPSSGGQIFRSSSSCCAKLVEVIDLISSDGDNNDVLPPPPSYRYEVGSDDEDSDNLLPPPPLHQNVTSTKHRTLLTVAIRWFDHCIVQFTCSLW